MVEKLATWLPAVTMVLYFVTSGAFLWSKRYDWALVYFAYALANVGLIWAALSNR